MKAERQNIATHVTMSYITMRERKARTNVDRSRLLRMEEIDNFSEARSVPSEWVTPEIIRVVKELDERTELEPYIRAILHDPNETPHGPAELVDILTHRLTVRKVNGIAAFIIKGRSFPTVRPSHVSHQIYRLEKIVDLRTAILAVPGIILDQAKEEFCSTASRISCHYAIFDAVDIARLMIAYGFICPRDARKIVSGRCNCGYSPRTRILNLFQKDSLSALEKSHARGESAGLIVLPPGSGKTRIAAEDALRTKANHVLYLAHTNEILDVAKSEFEAVFSAENVTRHFTARTFSSVNQINIATIQLVNENRHRFPLSEYDYVVIDEFHHAAARSYRKIINEVSPKYLLGLTATPFRGDRQDICELCGQNVLIEFELRSGIDAGVLSPYHYYGCFDDIDYSNLKYNGQHYDIRDLERRLIIPQRNNAVVNKWRELADGKSTIAFCCTLEHAKRSASFFNRAGVSSASYVSTTSDTERRELLQRLANGEIKILCAVDVLNEGADIPFVECLMFLRPTESKRIFYQQLGRGLRQYAGKTHCTVIDFIGNFRNAYKIVDYNSLTSLEQNEGLPDLRNACSFKDVLNLPLNCKVEFDQRVIEVFSSQTLNPQNATRHSIGRILLYEFDKLARRLDKIPTQIEVDRNSRLDSSFYKQVFGSWPKFVNLYKTKKD